MAKMTRRSRASSVEARARTAGWPFLGHAQRRSLVLPDMRLLFVPMPKGGCTSIMWLMAGMGGYDDGHFSRSLGHEVAPAMTVHDMSRWYPEHRWASQSPQRRREISHDQTWLRFTVVRDPASRQWSARQSKLLMREPFYTGLFGDAEWFPRVPRHAWEVVNDFRSFVRALAQQDVRPVDVHWAPQSLILDEAPPLTHTGRLEAIRDTFTLMEEHLGRPIERSMLRRENPGLLAYHPVLYDAETADIVNTVYARDFDAFGYTRVTPAPETELDQWIDKHGPAIGAVAGYIDRHERIAVLQPYAKRAGRRGRLKRSVLRRVRPRG